MPSNFAEKVLQPCLNDLKPLILQSSSSLTASSASETCDEKEKEDKCVGKVSTKAGGISCPKAPNNVGKYKLRKGCLLQIIKREIATSKQIIIVKQPGTKHEKDI